MTLANAEIRQDVDDQTAEKPVPVNTTTGLNANKELIQKLEQRIGLKPDQGQLPKHTRQVNKTLVKALKAYKRQDFKSAALRALDATRLDPNCAQAYNTLALALEGLGELYKALTMYEKAIQLDPSEADAYLNLGLIAWKLNMLEGAEKFFRIYINLRPNSHSGYNNLGGILRDMGRHDEAIEILRGAIYQIPGKAELWNSLGTVVMEMGQLGDAITFYEEAIRIDPSFARVYHNIAYTLNHNNELDGALEKYDKALELMKDANDIVECRHSRALCLLGMGQLESGWAEWEVRHDHRFRGSTIYPMQMPRWEGEDLSGKKLLIIGEQGLGDEIMFANSFDHLTERVGPDGQLLITCDHRLVPLFHRSFPTAKVGTYDNRTHNGKAVRFVPWLNDDHRADYYTPGGSALQYIFPKVEDFERDKPILTVDAEKQAQWQDYLNSLGDGPFVGVCWRSLVMTSARSKYFSPLENWAPVFENREATFINLQYGDVADDVADIAKRFGVTVHQPPELDLKDDLDGNAALCSVLDLVISAPTAASAIAGGVGTEVWLLTGGHVWPRLGAEHYPWYHRNRVFEPETYHDWPNLMAQVGESLTDFAHA